MRLEGGGGPRASRRIAAQIELVATDVRAGAAMLLTMRAERASHIGQQPVADVIHAQLAVIDLAVLGAAFLGTENLDVLAL
jgi:hypothetical protein